MKPTVQTTNDAPRTSPLSITKRPMQVDWQCLALGLSLLLRATGLCAAQRDFTHVAPGLDASVSVALTQFSTEELARAEFSAEGKHLGWLTNKYVVDSSSSPGDPFVVYDACYIPSSQLLLTVSGLPNYVKCQAWISKGGTLEPAGKPTLKRSLSDLRLSEFIADLRGDMETITNATLQLLSSSNAVVYLIDRGGGTNTAYWNQETGWSP